MCGALPRSFRHRARFVLLSHFAAGYVCKTRFHNGRGLERRHHLDREEKKKVPLESTTSGNARSAVRFILFIFAAKYNISKQIEMVRVIRGLKEKKGEGDVEIRRRQFTAEHICCVISLSRI